MNRYIASILLLSIIGALFSLLLMHQHFFPHSDFALAVCGSGLDNQCALLSRSGYSVLLGLPVAGYGLMGYLILIITASLALAGDGSWPLPCFALQLPVTAASVVTDIVLGSILVYLKLSCSLCIATYIVNILVCITMFVWYLHIKEGGQGLRSMYRNLIVVARNPLTRPAAAGLVFSVLFMGLFVFSISAFMGVTGAASEPSAMEMKKFEVSYYSLPQEELSLPASVMSLGPESSGVRIVVFTDFLCPACMKFHEVQRYLVSRFPGKLRFDYYSFPLDRVCNPHIPETVYPNSCAAAQAFSAAARRGKFMEFLEYHHTHYRENLPRLRAGDVMAGFEAYFKERSTADEYRIFMGEAQSDGARSAVRDAVEQGGAAKVRAVPTLFINGRRFEGVPEARLLEHVLAQELRGH